MTRASSLLSQTDTTSEDRELDKCWLGVEHLTDVSLRPVGALRLRRCTQHRNRRKTSSHAQNINGADRLPVSQTRLTLSHLASSCRNDLFLVCSVSLQITLPPIPPSPSSFFRSAVAGRRTESYSTISTRFQSFRSHHQSLPNGILQELGKCSRLNPVRWRCHDDNDADADVARLLWKKISSFSSSESDATALIGSSNCH